MRKAEEQNKMRFIKLLTKRASFESYLEQQVRQGKLCLFCLFHYMPFFPISLPPHF